MFNGAPWSRNITLNAASTAAQSLLAARTDFTPVLHTLRITAVNPAAGAAVNCTVDFYDGTTATVIHTFRIGAGAAAAETVTRDQVVMRAPAPSQSGGTATAEKQYLIRATLSAATLTSINVYLCGEWHTIKSPTGTHSATA